MEPCDVEAKGDASRWLTRVSQYNARTIVRGGLVRGPERGLWMAVSTLRVDLQSLKSAADTLATLTSNIESTTNVNYGDLSTIGAQPLISAVQSFEDDWSFKRKKLLESLNAVHKMLVHAHKQYAAVDSQLACALSSGK